MSQPTRLFIKTSKSLRARCFKCRGKHTTYTKVKKKKENPSFGYVNSLRLVGETTN